MDAKVKKEWIEALRSGQYGQTTGTLRRCSTDEYCCLGVLATIIGAKFEESAGFYKVYFSDVPDFWMGGIPNKTLNQLGMTLDQHATLANLNDAEKYTFNQIASWIEENL